MNEEKNGIQKKTLDRSGHPGPDGRRTCTTSTGLRTPAIGGIRLRMAHGHRSIEQTGPMARPEIRSLVPLGLVLRPRHRGVIVHLLGRRRLDFPQRRPVLRRVQKVVLRTERPIQSCPLRP